MPETIAEAYVQIKPSMEGISSELESALGSAGSSGASSFSSGFSSALSGLGKVGAVAVGAATAATGALVGNIVSATSSVAEYGDNIDKMSQKMGISATAYQEWEAVMQHSGTSMETLKASMKTMASAAESGNEAFEKLGISQEEVASLSQEDLFSKVIAGLQDMGEGTERTYLAGQLLGRGATELGALLNTSAEDTEAMKQRVHELGGVMSDDAVAAAAGFQDSLQDMQTALSGITRGIMGEFLPSITGVMDGLANIFSGDKELGLQQIQDGIDEFITNLTAKLPEMMEIGLGIIEAIASSIINNLPTIIQTGLDILLSLAQGIIENLPTIIPAVIDVIMEIISVLTDPNNITQFVNAAIQMILALADGLLNALPVLIERLPEIIGNIVTALIENLPLLIDGAIQLVVGIVTHLPEIIAGLIEAIPEIIASILGAFGPIGEGLATLFTEAWNGIKEVFSGVGEFFGEKWNSVKEATSTAWDNIKSDIDEHGGGIKGALGAIGDNIKKNWQDRFREMNEATGGRMGDMLKTVQGKLGNMKDKFLEIGKNAINWGKDMIDNFVSGIKEKFEKVKETVANVAQTVKDFLGFSEPDKGPLANFHTFAPDMLDLFSQGITQNISTVRDAMGSLASAVAEGTPGGEVVAGSSMNRTLATDMGIGPQVAAAGAGGGTITIPVYIGQNKIETIVVDALTRANYRAGGR